MTSTTPLAASLSLITNSADDCPKGNLSFVILHADGQAKGGDGAPYLSLHCHYLVRGTHGCTSLTSIYAACYPCDLQTKASSRDPADQN